MATPTRQVEATVSFSDLNAGTFDEEASYTVDDGGGIITHYRITNRYERDHHKYMMPVASDDPGLAKKVYFVQLARPTLIWICEWQACRLDDHPPVPDSTPRESGWELLDEHINSQSLVVGPDGVTPAYGLSGVYIYGHTDPASILLANVRFPRPPWLQDLYPRELPQSVLTVGLIDGKGQGGSVGFIDGTSASNTSLNQDFLVSRVEGGGQ